MSDQKLRVVSGMGAAAQKAISADPLLCQLYEEVAKREKELNKDTSHCEMGIQSCYRPQRLSSVSFRIPAMLLVISGRKEIQIGNQTFVAQAGEMLIVPGDCEVWLGKHPDDRTGSYQGIGIRFDLDIIKQFQNYYGQNLDSWDIAPRWTVAAPAKLIAWLIDWLRWSREYPSAKQIQRHRLVELLLILAQGGLAGNILISRSPSWRQRVSQLIRIDPAHEWRSEEVSLRLKASESSLRRKLKLEDTSFREILEETRLMAGLNLMQESTLSIGRIAEAVGYQSQSRFTDRFKLRFNVTPTGLRKTFCRAGEEIDVNSN